VLFDELARCRPWIEAALEHTCGSHTFDDVASGIYAGRFFLFAKPRGCAVLEFNDYPQKRGLNVFLVGGELDEILTGIEEIKALAREAGASEITMTGRSGWERVLAPQGWDKVHVVMRHEV
jgi:hypothetical protein